MSRVRFSYILLGAAAALGACNPSFGATPSKPAVHRVRLASPLVLVQLPAGMDSQRRAPVEGGMLRAAYGERGRLLLLSPNRTARVLTQAFHSACDPEVSFDAKHILFAAKRTASDHWNIYEMDVDGSDFRQITRDFGDCRSPGYQSTLYTIISPKPWHQLTFVSDAAGTMNEHGTASSLPGRLPATHLYSCKRDGSATRRLTFNLSSDFDPILMPDGRLVFASWQRRTLERGILGRIALFGINLDGTDHALFAGPEGKRIQHMPCATSSGLLVFVEADEVPWDGSGCLSCVRLRRPLHSYRQLTTPADGLFHSPSPLPDGSILVSRRPAEGSKTHGVYRLDPQSGKAELIFDDPRYHDIQAKLIRRRTEPDGRSSVVTEEDPYGKLYCLNVYLSDLLDRSWMPRGMIKRLRVLEGVPLKTDEPGAELPTTGAFSRRPGGSSPNGIPPLVQRRILGEIRVERDGSLNIEIPANTPIELQILDADGMALRSCGWIWAKNHEPRGCIGCHEDGELTPENTLIDAVTVPSIPLRLPPHRRRTVDFRRDVMPILNRNCARCHREGGPQPRLCGGLELVGSSGKEASFNRAYLNLLTAGGSQRGRGVYERYVHPGKARTSPLIWQLFGRNTSRPWDGAAARRPFKRSEACRARSLGDDEKRTLVEWIDLGALWDGIPGSDDLPGKRSNLAGEKK